MRIIACIDDNGGMMFNKRRQSRDRTVTADILELTAGHLLRLNEYSEKLFEEGQAVVGEAFLAQAQEEDFCFVENQSVQPYLEQVHEIILYKWNRTYPSDFYFDVDMSVWTLTDVKEWEGSSHEKITRERYRKGGTE